MSKPILEKNRLEAFSDGVIAIIITLLVLEIKVPHIEGIIDNNSIANSLYKLLPKILSWAISFFMILVMWVNHHRIFNDVKQSDNGLMWLNGLLLFFISFVPFPTAFLGDYFNQPFSTFFFGICLTLVGISFSGLRFYLYINCNLLTENFDKNYLLKLFQRSLLSPILYIIGSLFAFINIYVSFIIYIIVPIFFIFYATKNLKNDA